MSDDSLGALADRWNALHHTADAIAELAGLSPERAGGAQSGFAAKLGDASAWQHEAARQGIDDIDAMMRPGLAALGTLAARGKDTSVPAQTLWREFHHAREAVLALVQSRTD